MNPPPFQLQWIDHVVLRVRDAAAMQAFYCDVLGCRVERRVDAIGLLQLRAGAALIDLVPATAAAGDAGPAAAPAGGAGATAGADAAGRNLDHLCLRVAPFDRHAILAHLQAHRVRVGSFGMRYGAEGEGPSQYLFDPEGNLVELKGPPAAAAGPRA